MKCQFINQETKEQCRANSMAGQKWCYWHNPDVPEAKKQEARAKGGRREPVLPKRSLSTAQQIAEHLEEITNLVREEKISDKKASLLNNLSGNILKALELSDLEDRVEELEEHALGNTTKWE